MFESDERMSMSFWPSVIVLVSSWSSTTTLCYVLPLLLPIPSNRSRQSATLVTTLYTVSSLSIASLSSRRTVPFKTLLQAEELPEGEVV